MDKEILETLKRLEGRFDNLEGKFDNLEGKFDEHTQILRALEHLAEVNKAEHDKMGNNIEHIMGDIKGLRKDITNVEIITSSNWTDLAKLKSVK